MSNKLTFSFDATALGSSACIEKFKKIVVGEFDENNIPQPEGGYKAKALPAAVTYGIAVHKFVDVMYKSGGHIHAAREQALQMFNLPTQPPASNKAYLRDQKHFLTVCYQLWTEYIEGDKTFELIQIPQDCWWCKGKGKTNNGGENIDDCVRCEGKGTILGPATEITFRLPIYEDDLVIINLAGTLDGVGKITNGCYSIRDWKTTSSWQDEYFVQYELSRQLRVYTLALKMMGDLYPDSIIGKIGQTKFRAFIDGVFLKSKLSEVEFKRSDAMIFSEQDLNGFKQMLLEFCKKFSDSIKNRYWPKEGILNGECIGRYGYKCQFWHVCKSNEQLAQVLLKRDFLRKPFDPLSYNEE